MKQAKAVVSKPGRGGARLRSEPLTVVCGGCHEPFEWLKCGRLPRLCLPCRDSLRYCPKCESVKELAAFFATPKHGGACRSCAARRTPHTCSACGVDFMRAQRGSLQGRRAHLCDQCEGRLKWCSTCDEVKALDEFSRASDKRTGRAAKCVDCMRALHAARTSRELLERRIKKYGISLAEWDAMYAAQAGLCASCGRPPLPNSRGLVVDHDHGTEEVRGLLCSPCNIGIGHFGDDPAMLRMAAAYLDRERRVAQ